MADCECEWVFITLMYAGAALHARFDVEIFDLKSRG